MRKRDVSSTVLLFETESFGFYLFHKYTYSNVADDNAKW